MTKACYTWMWDHAAAFSRRGGYPLQELAEAAIQKFCPFYATSSKERKERIEDQYWFCARAIFIEQDLDVGLDEDDYGVWDGRQ